MNSPKIAKVADKAIDRFPIKLTSAAWWRIVIAAWMLVFGVSFQDHLKPAGWWMTVSKVHVYDSVVGKSPRMDVDRLIRRPFTARWRAEIEKLEPNGFSYTCQGSSVNNYGPATQLPADLDLAWWLEKDCFLTPGQYRVDTVWTIYADNGASKRIRVVSNTFTIRFDTK